MVLATLDVSPLYTNIPQEGIEVVCSYFADHYEQKLPIPTSDLRKLMRIISEENSFKAPFVWRKVVLGRRVTRLAEPTSYDCLHE